MLNQKCKTDYKFKGAVWNTLGSMMFALNSMLLVLIVSRTSNLSVAGEFGIAFTNAQILYIIGLYGINVFQMTDYENKYDFKTYFRAKLITTGLMVGIAILLICFYLNTQHKRGFTVLLTIYMGIYSFAEVYQSYYFKRNRLDLSGKSLFYRTLFSIIGFYIVLKLTQSVYIALIVLIISNLIAFYFFTYNPILKLEREALSVSNSLNTLFLETTPIFFSVFMMNIIANITKYVIDLLKPSEVQAYYNVIFMPVMVINLLSSFIFKPMLSQYATYISLKDKAKFYSLVLKHIMFILVLTIVTVGGTWILGVPVLSLLYKIPIEPFKLELLLVVIVGGIFAVASLFYFILIIMRRQKKILLSYIIGSLIEVILAFYLVGKYSILGAVFSLGIAQIVLISCFFIIIYKYTEGW